MAGKSDRADHHPGGSVRAATEPGRDGREEGFSYDAGWQSLAPQRSPAVMAGKRVGHQDNALAGSLAATEPGRDGREEPTRWGENPRGWLPQRSPAVMAGKSRAHQSTPEPTWKSPQRSPAVMAGKRPRPRTQRSPRRNCRNGARP